MRHGSHSTGCRATPSLLLPRHTTTRCEPDAEANLEKALARIRQAAAAGAQITCLPELFRTPYFCQRQDPAVFDLAQPIPEKQS